MTDNNNTSPQRIHIQDSDAFTFEQHDLYVELSKDAIRFSRLDDGTELFSLTAEQLKDITQQQQRMIRQLAPLDMQMVSGIMQEFAQYQKANAITGMMQRADGGYVVFITDPKTLRAYEIHTVGEYEVVRDALLYSSIRPSFPR